MSDGQRHPLSGAGRGAIRFKLPRLCQSEVDSGILKKWKQCGAVQASCGCLVGHACMGVPISDLPHNSATLQLQVLMNMQMDAEFKKEQIGTLICLVGALDGEFGGWVVPQGCPPKKRYVPQEAPEKIRKIGRAHV